MSSLTTSLLVISLLISFGFSIVEKLTDKEAYQSWLKKHFQESFVVSYIKPLFYFVILLELISTILLLYGLFELVFNQNYLGIYLGAIASFISFIILLIGQRISKDYQSAANLILYILISIITVYLSELGLE